MIRDACGDPFISALPLYRKLRQRLANVTRADVVRAINTLASHQIQRAVQRETVARPAVSRREGSVWQVDIKDLMHEIEDLPKRPRN